MRVDRDIPEDERLLRRDHLADDALRELDAEIGVRVAHRVPDAELAALFVEQVHGERVELDQPADQLRNTLQQLVEVDDGRDLAAQVEQVTVDVLLVALVEPAGNGPGVG